MTQSTPLKYVVLKANNDAIFRILYYISFSDNPNGYANKIQIDDQWYQYRWIRHSTTENRIMEFDTVKSARRHVCDLEDAETGINLDNYDTIVHSVNSEGEDEFKQL